MALTDWTPEEIAEMQSKGIDPRYATPTINQQGPPSALSTIGKTAQAHAGSYLGGGAGALAGGGLASAYLAPWLLGPEAGIPADLLIAGTGIVGALAGGYGGQKAQQAIESPETYQAQQEAAAQAAEQHPNIAEGTDITAGALASGGMFSPTTAVKGVGGIIGKLTGRGAGALIAEQKGLIGQAAKAMASGSQEDINAIASRLGSIREALPEALEQNKAMRNVLMQAAINPAISTGLSLAQGQGIPPMGELSAQALGGSLFAKSWLPGGRMRTEPKEEAGNKTGTTIQLPNRPNQLQLPDARRFYGDNGGQVIDINAETIEPNEQNPNSNRKLLPENAGSTSTGGVGLVFTPEILQRLIDKGATVPNAVKRIFPNLNLSTAEAIEALRQADLLAELHLNRPNEGEENATGIRENTGQPNITGEVGEGSQVRSSGNLVETTPRSEEPISPQERTGLPEGEKGPVNAPLAESDYTINAAEMVRNSKEYLGIEPNYNGVFNGSQLLATLFNRITPMEQEMYKKAGIIEHFQNRKISKDDAVKWIKENTTKVGVVSYGMEGKVSEAKKEYDKMTHDWYEQQPEKVVQAIASAHYRREAYLDNPLTKELPVEYQTKEYATQANKYLQLKKQIASEPIDTSPRATSYYSRVSALPADEPMPEWTTTKSGKNVQRVDVVIPSDMQKQLGRNAKDYERDPSVLWQQDNLHENLPNTLGWAMIQYKTGPNGEKIAVINEAQSRWGPTVRERMKQELEARKNNYDKLSDGDKQAADKYMKQLESEQHPLLRDYNRLILKAAIERARKERATHIMVSDYPTVAHTEGWDTQYKGPYTTLEDAEQAASMMRGSTGDNWIVEKPEQTGRKNEWLISPHAGGGRLNYDTILQKIAEELTGSKGERVSLGEHKNAYTKQTRWNNDRLSDEIVNEKRTNLIFRNADGTPKTDVSGTMYPIDKVPSRNPKLFGKNYSPLSDYNRYQELDRQRVAMESKITDPEELMANPEYQAISRELESIKNKHQGQVPPQFPENHVLMPVQLQSHILSGKATTGSLVNGLANTPGHPFQELFKEIEKILTPKDAAVKWVHDPTLDKDINHRSNYNPVTDRVNIGTGSAGDARVVTEELLHSMTAKKIPNFEGQGAEYYNRLQAYLKNGNNPHVKDLINAYLETAKAKGWHDQLFKDTVNEDGSTTKGLAGKPDLTQKGLVGAGQGTAYAMGHLDEYLVHAFRTPEFQRELNSIKDPSHDGRPLWQSIVNAVRNLLGLSPKAGNMLDRVLRTGTEIIHEPRSEEGGYPQNLREPLNKPPEFEDKVEPHVRPFLGPMGNFFSNAILAARKVAPDVADAYHRLFNAKTELYGRVYGNVKNVMERTGFTKNDGDRLLEAARMEELNKSPVPMSFFKNQAQKQVWNEYKRVYREQGEEAVKDKQPVFDPHMGGYRPRRLSDTSHPLMLNQKIGNILRENTDTIAVNKLKQEFLADQARRGITPDQAQKNLDTVIKGIQGQASRQGTGNLNWFNANRRAMGTPLPDSWTIQDFEHNLRAYASRNASDRAHFKYIESNPSVMAQLGETTGPWGNPIPKTDKPVVASNKDIQILSKEAHGEVGPQGFYTERAGSSAATALFIASPALSAVHVPISNLAGVVSLTRNPLETSRTLWSGLKGMVSGVATARKNGIMVPAARPAADMWDNTLTAAERWQAAASIVRRVASLNDLVTKGNIGFMQSAMEYLVPSRISRAIHGDVTSQQWLRKLDTDYTVGKQYSLEEVQQLASRAVGYLHGTNDPRTMPEWMMRDSEVSGFFSIAHWSVAQTDRFMRDVWTPATKGDMTPLVMSLFGATIGGYVIKELREQISGKHSPIPSLSEIAASDRQFRGNAGPLAYNMIAALQYAGFGGMFSQLAKYPFDMAYKNSPQGAAFPLDEEVSDLATTAYNVASAIANDPNINYVDLAKLVGSHVLTSDFRLSREAYHQMINAGMITGTLAERKMLSDKLGQLRRFQQVEGLPFQAQGTMSENPYMYPEQQEFKRTQDLQGAIKSLPVLINNIMQQYHNNPDVMMAKLRALKETQYSTFPSLEQMPLSFMKYMGYLSRYEGPDAAHAELMDYMKHKMVNEVKGSVVP